MIYMIEFRAMGCAATIQVESDMSDAAISEVLAKVPAHVDALEHCLTRFDPSSELMGLNARAGRWVTVSKPLFAVVDAAKHAAQLTDGLYNPLLLPALTGYGYDRDFNAITTTPVGKPCPPSDWRHLRLRAKTHEVFVPVGGALDLGGIAKGWASAYLADQLAAYGPCLVNLGGDITARGGPTGFPGWPVSIEEPFTGEVFASLHLCDQTIATSGTDYRRWYNDENTAYHHILDPRTGAPAISDAIAITVVHPEAVVAEAYAIAVLLRGTPVGLRWLQQQRSGAGIAFTQNGEIYATQTITSQFYERKPKSCHILLNS